MKRKSTVRPVPEEMGLRLESTAEIGLVDAVLIVALLLSAAAWLCLSVMGPEPRLLGVVDSAGGRLLAASIGVASVGAVLRSLCNARGSLFKRDDGLG